MCNHVLVLEKLVSKNKVTIQEVAQAYYDVKSEQETTLVEAIDNTMSELVSKLDEEILSQMDMSSQIIH